VSETVLAFALASLIIELTPGPNMAWLALLSLERGRLAGFTAVAGVALGLLILGLGAGFGLGTLIAETPWLYQVLRWGGIAFLLYLAWDGYRETQKPAQAMGGNGRLIESFWRGLVSNLLNPKAALFYISVLPNFIDPAASRGPQALSLTIIYVAIATAVHAGIAMAASLIQPLFAANRLRRWFGVFAAVVLVAIAAWVWIST
jgi:threonine/homoserine/homoserine lactone efflux protein